MSNELWRVDSDWLHGYTEDRALMRKIKRYYTDFEVIADYYKFNRFIGLQYRIPSKRKRAARHVFGINLNGVQNRENKAV
ncbi:hypothetical protein [Sutcliffiella horikoshii]|uniref:hypothetical protein n=1 Tax=Sutcliffiella horikoshii TaxID=79883 RepID=UPI00385142B4